LPAPNLAVEAAAAILDPPHFGRGSATVASFVDPVPVVNLLFWCHGPGSAELVLSTGARVRTSPCTSRDVFTANFPATVGRRLTVAVVASPSTHWEFGVSVFRS
jgi:hypothetical protein